MTATGSGPARLSIMVYGIELDAYPRVAQAAEAAGLDVVWVADHLIAPTVTDSIYPYDPSGSMGFGPDAPIVDLWVALTAMSMVTDRIRLGSGVYVLPLRDPFVTARAVGSAQVVSGGRLLFGVGTGWQREEFDTVGIPFAGRGRRTDDILDLLSRLWAGDPVDVPGVEGPGGTVQFAPRLDPPPPVIVGGLGRRALVRAARADGWFGPRCELGEAVAAREEILRRRLVAGATGPFTAYARVFGELTPGVIDRYRSAGFDDLVTTMPAITGLPFSAPLDEHLDGLGRVAGLVAA